MSRTSKRAKSKKKARIAKSAVPRMPKIAMAPAPKSTMPQALKIEGHCPPFDPRKWDGRELVFDHKWFAKEHVTSLFHMPLNFGPVLEKMMKQAKAMDAQEDDFLVLSDENSSFGADIYLAVKKNTPGLACGTISGKFHTKVFEGPYSNMGKWIGEMKTYVNGKGRGIMRLLFFYPVCPDCSKKTGRNYTVIFAQVE